MLNVRYIHIGNDVTCLLTEDGQFIGGVRNSTGGPEVWAFAVDPNDAIILNIKSTLAEGGEVGDLYRRCEQSLLQRFPARPEETAHSPLSGSASESPVVNKT